MARTERRIFPLDTPMRGERVIAPGFTLAVLRCPTAAALRIGVDDSHEGVFMTRGSKLNDADGFQILYLWAEAVPGAELELAIGQAGTDFQPAGPGELGPLVAQGDAGIDAWLVSDGQTHTKLDVLAPLARNALALGNPAFEQLAAPAAATPYTLNVNGLIGRNARRGVIFSPLTNAGAWDLCVSSDGVTFSAWFVGLEPGAGFDLDGLDVHSVRVRSSAAGDNFSVGAM